MTTPDLPLESGTQAEGIDSLDWSVRPLKERPGRLALILAIAVLAFVLGVLFFGQLLMGVLGFAMIWGSTMDHWQGASFHLDSDRARSRVGASLSEIRWPDVKRVLVGKRMIRLSPLARTSRLDSFRGVLLRTEPANHSKVVDFVRQHTCSEAVHEVTADEPN